MIARIELHTRRPVIVKRTSGHAVMVDLDAVMLRRLSGSDGGFDRFKNVHDGDLSDVRIGGSVVK